MGQPHWGLANGSGSWGQGGHSGTQYAFIQTRDGGIHGTLEQTVTGFVPGRHYQVEFWMSRRNGSVGGNTGAPMNVSADATVILANTSPTNDGVWNKFTTSTFTATKSSYLFKFAPVNNGQDRTNLLDDISLLEVP